MLESDKLAIYQELHTQLVYADISLNLATRLISATGSDAESVIEYALETACMAIRASACRIIIFSDIKKRYDYSFPHRLSKNEEPAYEKFLCHENLVSAMEKLAKNGLIELSYHDMSCDQPITTDESYFIIPISKKTIYDYSGFLEITVSKLRNNSTDVEFLKMVGVLLLSAIKRIELESIIQDERDTLVRAVELTTTMIEYDVKAKVVG